MLFSAVLSLKVSYNYAHLGHFNIFSLMTLLSLHEIGRSAKAKVEIPSPKFPSMIANATYLKIYVYNYIVMNNLTKLNVHYTLGANKKSISNSDLFKNKYDELHKIERDLHTQKSDINPTFFSE